MTVTDSPHTDLYTGLTDLLRTFLHRADMTQAELAGAVDVTPAALSQWMTGKTRPSTEHCMRLVTLVKARDLCEPELSAQLVRALAGALEDQGTSIAKESLYGLADYGADLTGGRAQALRNTTFDLIDRLSTPLGPAEGISSYICRDWSLPAAQSSNFLIFLQSLGADGPELFARSLTHVAKLTVQHQDRLGKAARFAWVPVPVLAHSSAPDAFTRASVISGTLRALSENTPSFTSLNDSIDITEPLAGRMNALSLLAYRAPHELASEAGLQRVSSVIPPASMPAIRIVFMAEFIRRGRASWLDDKNLSIVARHIHRLLPMNKRGSGVLMSCIFWPTDTTAPKAIQDTWDFVTQHRKNVARGASQRLNKHKLIEHLITHFECSQDNQLLQYLSALAIHDLFMVDAPDPDVDLIKVDSAAEAFWEYFQARLLPSFSGGVAMTSFAALALIDVAHRLYPSGTSAELAEILDVIPDHLASSILCQRRLWRDKELADRARTTLRSAKDQKTDGLLWLCSALRGL